MKPFLDLEDGPRELTIISFYEGQISTVAYFENSNCIIVNNKDVEGDLADKIVWKDNESIKKLENLLADELELHNDLAHDIAHATDTESMLKLQTQYNMQDSKITGIETSLKLLQGGE